MTQLHDHKILIQHTKLDCPSMQIYPSFSDEINQSIDLDLDIGCKTRQENVLHERFIASMFVDEEVWELMNPEVDCESPKLTEIFQKNALKFNNHFYIGEHPRMLDGPELQVLVNIMMDRWVEVHLNYVKPHRVDPDADCIMDILNECSYYYIWVDHGMRHLIVDPDNKVYPDGERED